MKPTCGCETPPGRPPASSCSSCDSRRPAARRRRRGSSPTRSRSNATGWYRSSSGGRLGGRLEGHAGRRHRLRQRARRAQLRRRLGRRLLDPAGRRAVRGRRGAAVLPGRREPDPPRRGAAVVAYSQCRDPDRRGDRRRRSSSIRRSTKHWETHRPPAKKCRPGSSGQPCRRRSRSQPSPRRPCPVPKPPPRTPPAREKLDSQIRRSTSATDAAVAANKDYIDSLMRQTAIADDELRPAMARARAGDSVTSTRRSGCSHCRPTWRPPAANHWRP